MLRQEVYALDGTAEQDRPYTVTERELRRSSCCSRRPATAHAVSCAHPRETITCHYERGSTTSSADGRAASPTRGSHELTLEVDAYGNVLRGVAVGYGRRHPDADADPRLPAGRRGGDAAQTTTHRPDGERVHQRGRRADAYRTPLPARVAHLRAVTVPPVAGGCAARRAADAVRRGRPTARTTCPTSDPTRPARRPGAVPPADRARPHPVPARRPDRRAAARAGAVARPAVRELPARVHPGPARPGLPARATGSTCCRRGGGAARRGRLPAGDDSDGRTVPGRRSGRLLVGALRAGLPTRRTRRRPRPPSWRTRWRTSSCPAGSAIRSAPRRPSPTTLRPAAGRRATRSATGHAGERGRRRRSPPVATTTACCSRGW